nr:Neuron navigator like [Ipomoea batatas]
MAAANFQEIRREACLCGGLRTWEMGGWVQGRVQALCDGASVEIRWERAPQGLRVELLQEDDEQKLPPEKRGSRLPRRAPFWSSGMGFQGAKKKAPTFGNSSVNLAENLLPKTEEKEFDINIPQLHKIRLSTLQRACGVRSFSTEVGRKFINPRKNELSALESWLTNVKIFTEYVVNKGKLKKLAGEDDGSDGSAEKATRVRVSFYSNKRISAGDEDFVYYSKRQVICGSQSGKTRLLLFQWPPVGFLQSKRSNFPWRKRKLSFRPEEDSIANRSSVSEFCEVKALQEKVRARHLLQVIAEWFSEAMRDLHAY